MNDGELNELLKSAHPPERPADYWEQFPGTVLVKLHRQPQGTEQPGPSRRSAFPAWALGLAAACVVAGFVLGFWRGHLAKADDPQLVLAQKYYREFEALFPNQVRAIVLDSDGPHMVLAEKPDVPASTPYYVKVCGPAGCHSFITFSGQQIQVNGQTCDVLADGEGRLMLVTDHAVWSESDPAGAVRVTARHLQTTL